MKSKSCGVIPFIKVDNKIEFLLIKHLNGHWSFPKGQKQPGESELETAKREFSEETGISKFRINDNKIFFENYNFIKNEKEIEKEVVYFLGEVRSKKVNIQQAEISEYKWLDYKNALETLSHEEMKKILTEANDYLNGLQIILSAQD